jgi:hypothetical protein
MPGFVPADARVGGKDREQVEAGGCVLLFNIGHEQSRARSRNKGSKEFSALEAQLLPVQLFCYPSGRGLGCGARRREQAKGHIAGG